MADRDLIENLNVVDGGIDRAVADRNRGRDSRDTIRRMTRDRPLVTQQVIFRALDTPNNPGLNYYDPENWEVIKTNLKQVIRGTMRLESLPLRMSQS